MKAIILAAGFGKRLGGLTTNLPKALIRVASRPLIAYALRFARQIGVADIVVVGGFQMELLWEALDGEPVKRIENPEFHKGNLYSLAAAYDDLQDGFLQLNVDHLYPSIVARRIKRCVTGIRIVSDFDRRLYDDDMKIRIQGPIDGDARVTAISKTLRNFDGGYCGVTIVAADGVKPYLSALDAVLERQEEQAVVEDVISELIRRRCSPGISDISGIRWLEVDTAEDLSNAERIIRIKPAFLD